MRRPNLNECAPQNLPWDTIGPGVRRQVTQVGYGGPFVLRSNPIGGILDTIRGWCFPTPMTEGSDGSYMDDTGAGLDSAGLGGGSLGLSGGGAYFPQLAGYTPGAGYCGPGLSWDNMTQMCQPADMLGVPAMGPAFVGDSASLENAKQKLVDAYSTCDLPGVTAVLRLAGVQAKLAPGDLRAQWNDLAKGASQAYNDLKKRKNRKAMAGENDPCAAAGMVMSASAGQMNRRQPATANPMTLTESGPKFRPSLDPMVGMFSPRRPRL